jgi:hypothetical protein
MIASIGVGAIAIGASTIGSSTAATRTLIVSEDAWLVVIWHLADGPSSSPFSAGFDLRQQAQFFSPDIGQVDTAALCGTALLMGGHAQATAAQLRFEMSRTVAINSRPTTFTCLP